MDRLYKLAQEFEKKIDSEELDEIKDEDEDNDVNTEDRQEPQNKDDAGARLATMASVLRGLAIIHQVAHWTTKSNTYYGDHLLYDRLYSAVTEHIDTVAEKTIGVYGLSFISLASHCQATMAFVDDINKIEANGAAGLAKRSLIAEEAFLDLAKEVYNALKEDGSLTLGVDDMIMSIASKHEEHVYLLKQRLTGTEGG